MLKSLELFGFKSFADRTKFDFSPGITGVVGPNGSGKSNIVDAIKWILGDQSAKSLRGKEMTDVIFNGAAGRKPNSFAEATLTFDNASGFLPTELQEVQVGRRIWQNGDSEYLINRNAVRLKDVRELFMGTGAGSTAYCIIEQGRVDQILQANATNRRLVFEEAAGISRFKARKNEALRKLERVDQNLLRLTDIVDEIDAQRTTLRSQAVKAAKFREVSEDLRELWLGLAADDYRHLTRQLEDIDHATGDLASRTDEFESLHQQIEGRLQALDVEIAEVDDQLREVERHSATNRETIASHQATIRHQTSRQLELVSEADRLRKQRAMMEARVREIASEREQNKQQLDQFDNEFSRRQQNLKAADEGIHEFSTKLDSERRRVETDRERMLDGIRRMSELSSRLTGLESQLESVAVNRQAVGQSREQIDEQIAACRADCERHQLRVSEFESRLTVATDRVQSIEANRQTLLSEHNEFQQTLAQQREARTAAQARKSVLEDLELRQEGLGIGVKEILSRAQTSNYPPWNRILGSVADLIDVDLEQAALLEVALGSRAQLIVLEAFEPLIEYLNGETSQISGRVGFVTVAEHSSADEQPFEPHDSADQSADLETDREHVGHFRLDPAKLRDISDQPHVVDRADRVVRSSERVPRLAEQLLADTWIVETLDAALTLSKGAGRGCRFVTQQGELLLSDGTLYVGTVSSETALVSRKSELRRLKNDLAGLDLQISKEEHRLSNLDSSLTDTDGELDSALSEMHASDDQLTEHQAALAEEQRELDRLRRDRQASLDELETLAEREEQLRDQLQQAQREVAQSESDLQMLQIEIDKSEQDVVHFEQELQSLQQQRSAEQLDLATREERLNNVQASHGRIEQELTQRIQQSDESQRRLEAAESKRRQIVLHILNTSAILAELALEEEASAGKTSMLLDEKKRLRLSRSKLVEEETSLRKQQQELSDLRHQKEMKVGDIRHQITTLEERIAEEFQLELTEVVNSGASAVKRFLEETNGRTVAEDAEDRVEDVEQVDPEIEDSSDEGVPTESVDDIETTGETAQIGDTADSTSPKPQPTDLPAEMFNKIRDEIETKVNRLRRKLKTMGNVDTDSLQNLEELEQRYSHLNAQLEDLVEAKTSLEEIVRRIDMESKRLFVETFESIRGYFQELFRKLFGGGEGDIILEDPEDILDCGIDVVARPPGKELRSISLLSGGEKTMTAVALLLAIFKSRPSPFCILDEVDAALDEANVDRFVGLLQEFRSSTQFIMVTHRKPSMTVADLLYGITMEQSGVSKRMTVRFEDVSENGEFTASSTDPSLSQSGQAGDVSDAA